MRVHFVWCVPLLLAGLMGCQNKPATESAGTAGTKDATESVSGTAGGSGTEQSSTGALSQSSKPAAAAPVVRSVEVPTGAVLRVRLDQSISTETNQPGDKFTGTLAEPVMESGAAVLAKGTRFTGRVTGSKSSGRLTGQGYLSLVLESFQLDGNTYEVTTTSISRATRGHKKRNTALIGGGTGLGAIVGAIAGGGKGAAIGAAAGAGAGTAGAAATGKQEAAFPAETLLQFTLKKPVNVQR